MNLNQAQAEAVYAAMCALNNVGARAARLSLPFGSVKAGKIAAVTISEEPSGLVALYWVDEENHMQYERHPTQSAFATAYGLDAAQRHYAVTGRICGDNEDTLLLVRGKNHEEAVEAFKDELRVIRNVDAEDQDETEIFIGAVVWSSTPINE